MELKTKDDLLKELMALNERLGTLETGMKNSEPKEPTPKEEEPKEPKAESTVESADEIEKLLNS